MVGGPAQVVSRTVIPQATRQQTAVPVIAPAQAEASRQDKEMSPKAGSLTIMKVSHTGKIEYLEQPIQKAKINKKICSKETVHVQRKQDNVGSKPSTSTGSAAATGDISMKLEEFIMGSLKESLKVILILGWCIIYLICWPNAKHCVTIQKTSSQNLTGFYKNPNNARFGCIFGFKSQCNRIEGNSHGSTVAIIRVF